MWKSIFDGFHAYGVMYFADTLHDVASVRIRSRQQMIQYGIDPDSPFSGGSVGTDVID